MTINQMFDFYQYELDRELFHLQFTHNAGQLHLFLDLFANEIPFVELTANKLVNSPELDAKIATTKLHYQLLSY